MSTGLDLLQRLRQQQQRVKQQSQEKNERHLLQPAGGDKTTEDTQDVQKKTSPSYLNTITTIEVCLGPDCSGGGGGAALLEIEDLVSCREKMNTTTSTKSSTYDINNKTVVVVPGGCRDFCTMGPNVHVRNDVEKDIHYTRVNNPKRCRDIISFIYGGEEEESTSVQTTHTTKDSYVESLMRRREDSIRWQSHKDRAARERRLKVRERMYESCPSMHI